jgi:hypothetical protein
MLKINHILLLLILLASPHGLPDYRFMLQFFLPTHPQDHEPSISSTISFPICEPLFISPTSYRNLPMGPPPFIQFSQSFCPHWGIHFTLGHPFLYLYIFPTFFIVQMPVFPVFTFVFTVDNPLPFLATRNPCCKF